MFISTYEKARRNRSNKDSVCFIALTIGLLCLFLLVIEGVQ